MAVPGVRSGAAAGLVQARAERMRRLVLIMVVLLAAQVQARQGWVVTRTGHNYEGYVRIEPQGVVLVNLAQQLRLQVPTTNLARLLLWPEPTALPGPTNPSSDWGALPSPWQRAEVGPTLTPGQVKVYGGFFCVQAAGTNVAGECDAFHFVYKQAGPSSDLIARLSWAREADPSAQAGLMMRAGMSGRAACVFVGLTGGSRGFMGWRSTEGKSFQRRAEVRLAGRCWLRLKRRGDLCTAYSSVDGRRWTLLDSVSLELPDTLQAGLAVAGGTTGRPGWFGFDRVQQGPWLWTGPMLPRLLLVSGSTVVGPIDRVDEQAVHFLGAPPREPVATRCVAQIWCQWPTVSSSVWGRAARPGALLRTGRFVEGEFRGWDQGVVRISSVLLGLQRLDAEGDLAAVFLRATPAPAAPVVARTVDGSAYRGRIQALGQSEVLLEEPALGLCRLPVYELAEVWWAD